MHHNLTPYPEGSIRELWKVSSPLMISTLASLSMIFTDRVFLAHYSIEALNASVNAGTCAWALMAGIGMITSMSEVFVAQYNGARHFKRLGIPVWQMVWFALFSILFFLPIAIWGAPAIFGRGQSPDLEISYFRLLMIFSPGYALMMAFSGFFIGRGKTKIMIWLAIVANVINIALDRTLIFGIPGLVPELGIQGAAIATCIGYLFESITLGYLFLKEENRDQFASHYWRFNWKEMKKCCKIGIPQGTFYTLEVLGYAVFYWMMTSLGEKHITISSICQSVTILLSFFSDGLSRGAAAVAGNLIGSRRAEVVKKVMRSGIILIFFFSAASSLVFLIDQLDTIKLLFIQDLDPSFHSSLKICMIFACAYAFFEGLRWVFSGLLIAAGDTLFLLIAGSVSVWIFLLGPVYWIVVKENLSVEYAWGLSALYAGLLFLIYLLRFRGESWQKIKLFGQDPQPSDNREDKLDSIDHSNLFDAPGSQQE